MLTWAKYLVTWAPGNVYRRSIHKICRDKDLLLKSFPALDQVFSAVMRKEIE